MVQQDCLVEWADNKPVFYRFLQARGWDIEKAMLMYRNHLEWRVKWKLDEFVPSNGGPTPRFLEEFRFPELQEFKQCYQFGYHGVDHKGRPVYFDRCPRPPAFHPSG